MFDRFLNSTPTFYKWDKFWVGFIPAVVLPVLVFPFLYGITWANASLRYHEQLSWEMFVHSLRFSGTFLRVATLCCMPNAGLFFFFISRNYYNASRAVVFTTMLYVIALVIKDFS